MDVQVNWLAVLLAAISSMAVGSVWYAKSVFGARWMKLVNLDEKKAAEWAVPALIGAFVASLVTAYVLAHVTYLSNSFFGNAYMTDALTTAFWLWLGFTAARFFVHDSFERRPLKLTMMNIGNELVTMLVMAMIIGWLKP